MNKLSEFVEISSFNEDTALVQRGNKIYVKKRVPTELAYIYKILLENRHKNISDIIEVFEYEDCVVVIEEYINGKTLSALLSERGTLSEAETKSVIGQICDGLLFLHKHNIIHRDINPNNIMLTGDNQVKIIDFDISRSVRKGAVSDTVILGTAGYAAPEQFGFTQSSARTDIYAVGVLANVTLTGKMPNERLYGGRLGRVIAKATRMEASERYGSITAFKHAFTNEVDENTPPIIRALRRVPGFRTLTMWKAAIALIYYVCFIPTMVVFLGRSLVSVKYFLMTAVGEALLFVIPFALLTNLNDVWRRFSGNTKKAAAEAVVWAFLSFTAGACVLATVFENIL